MARSTRGGGTDAGFGEATARREAERVSRRQDEKRRERRDEEQGGPGLGAKRIPFFGNKDPPAEGALQQIEPPLRPR
jgi:hypothetical protein